MHTLPAETIRELVNYDPETGVLLWRKRRPKWFGDDVAKAMTWNRRWAGQKAFDSFTKHGRCRGVLFGKNYDAATIAWVCHHGEWPKGRVVHATFNTCDNSIANLRVSRIGRGKGVYKLPNGKWRAMANVDGVWRHVGCYATEREAQAAREALDVL